MRLIKGRTLSEVLAQHVSAGTLRSARRELLQVLLRVAEAVAYAHSQDIIHRDLKPENIMVGGLGEVLVLDWGLAKNLKGHEPRIFTENVLSEDELSELSQVGMTITGAVVGTPGYMSPEQLDGSSEIDGRADVFALGLILSELLTGQKAIKADTNVELVARTMSGGATLPRSVDKTVSRELDWIVEQSLAADFRERTASARDFVEQLQSVLSGEDVSAYPYSLPERVLIGVRRRPGLWMGVFGSLLLCSLILSLWLSLERERERSARMSLANQLALADESAKREDAELKAGRAESVLRYFNEARTLVKRGAPESAVAEKVDLALKFGGRGEQPLMAAAKIYESAGLKERAAGIYKEVTERFEPAYPALFSLHLMTLEQIGEQYKPTSYLNRILSLAERRGETNEYVLLSKANDLASEGRYGEALVVYERIDQYTLTMPSAFYNRGYCLSKLGRRDEAMTAYRRALKIKPSYVFAFTALANEQRSLKQYEESQRNYDRALKINADSVLALAGRGALFSDLGRLQEALRDLSRALELDPRSVRALNSRSAVYFKLGQAAKALPDLNRALELNPSFALAYRNRGTLLKGAGRRTEALSDFNRAVELLPSDAVNYYNRGVLLQDMRQWSEALSDFNKSIDLKPSYWKAYCNRGALLRAMNRREDALEDLNKAIELRPEMPDPLVTRGNLMADFKNYEEALSDYSRALKLDARLMLAWFNRAITYKDLGRIEEAFSDFARVEELAPQFANLYYARGKLAYKLKKMNRAYADFSKLMTLKPRFSMAFYYRGFLQCQERRWDEAERDFRRFLQLAPNHKNRAQVKEALAKIAKAQAKSRGGG